MTWYLKLYFSNNPGPISINAASRRELNQTTGQLVNEDGNVVMSGVNNLQIIVTAVVSVLKSYNEPGSGGSVGRRN